IGLVSNTANSSGQMFLNARSASAETGVDGSGSQVPFMTLGNGFDNNVAVGIGTTTPKNALDVAGTIRSTEVKVEATPWPDFVFDQDYQLPLLEEVKDYIDKNRHLPEIPSAVQVEEEGINLGEMNAKLLQKIEELTLYVIEINSEVQQLKLENEELKGMIAK
ncbi:MAG: TMF family protein, partial [Cyclobacteriaceae bacterium]|nr:TMF family protein [Cyclobacteriaceae bacterium HetDA_MAG_MS6]